MTSPCPSCGADQWPGRVCCDGGWRQLHADAMTELREAREEIALMREELGSQERAHAEEVERWRKLYEHQQRAHAPEVSRWRTAALQYAARLARLGQKVTMPDAPAALDELAQAAQDDGQYDPPVQN